MDPSQTSFFQLLRIGMKMVGPGVSKVVSCLATITLADGASVFIVSGTLPGAPLVWLPWSAQESSALSLSIWKDRSRTSCFLTLAPRMKSTATWRSLLMNKHSFWTEGQRPRAGTWIKKSRGSCSQFGRLE